MKVEWKIDRAHRLSKWLYTARLLFIGLGLGRWSGLFLWFHAIVILAGSMYLYNWDPMAIILWVALYLPWFYLAASYTSQMIGMPVTLFCSNAGCGFETACGCEMIPWHGIGKVRKSRTGLLIINKSRTQRFEVSRARVSADDFTRLLEMVEHPPHDITPEWLDICSGEGWPLRVAVWTDIKQSLRERLKAGYFWYETAIYCIFAAYLGYEIATRDYVSAAWATAAAMWLVVHKLVFVALVELEAWADWKKFTEIVINDSGVSVRRSDGCKGWRWKAINAVVENCNNLRIVQGKVEMKLPIAGLSASDIQSMRSTLQNAQAVNPELKIEIAQTPSDNG